VTAAEKYRDLGEAAWSWVLGQVRQDDGPWLPEQVTPEPTAGPASDRDSLYAGITGLAPVLAEVRLSRPLSGSEEALSAGLVERLARFAAQSPEPSYFDGLAGFTMALRLLAPGREEIALGRLSELAAPAGWETALDLEYQGPVTDLALGAAGVVLAAAWAGGPHAAKIMTVGGEAMLSVAERSEFGLDWRMWPGYRSSSPNFSHGTAGVASALAIAGHLLGRGDFLDAARLGATHLLGTASMDDGGFILPHTIPSSKREVEPVTYSWCHGPTGTSYLFAALSHAGVAETGGRQVSELHERCLHSVLSSGLPARLRPGFWDNDGRCCGTAGVGEVLLDAAQNNPSTFSRYLAEAQRMGDALADRAVRDGSGAYWRFIEYRQEDPLLPPGTGWLQGAAGIAAFLFRLARVIESGPAATVVDRPDNWWAVPASVRLTRPAAS
jgi:hypothetical protein